MTSTDPNDGEESVNSVDDDGIQWLDQEGRSWRFSLTPHEIILESQHQTLTIPAAAWARDIYVAQHGQSFIIRIDTFDAVVAFVVPADRAAPLLDHLDRRATRQPEADVPSDSVTQTPLLWPKVSPLAVWALICSSMVFVPIFGWLPAFVTVALLLLHRKKVRKARSWDQSRSICKAAAVLLVGGATVSVLGTLSMARPSIESPVAEGDLTPVSLGETGSPIVPARTIAQRGLESLEHINWGMLAAGLFVIVLSLSVHEAAHAITAWWLGDDFARQMGRVTLNPASHIDPIGTIVLPLLLFISGFGVFGWARPVPVRVESIKRRHRAHILISIAGPGSNLLLASASLALMLGLGSAVSLLAPNSVVTNFTAFGFGESVTASGFALASVFGPVCTVLKLNFLVNVFLAVFNLIPVPPLDGSWVLEHMFPRTFGPIYARIRPYGFLVFLFLIFSGTNILLYLLLPAQIIAGFGLLLLGVCTPFA